ncbi:MAG: hypothetical protein ABI364_02210, partial [Caldimonas sp.]
MTPDHRPVSSRGCAAALATLIVCLGAWRVAPAAAATGEEQSEQLRIATERAQVDVRFAARERECRERFVVTSCVDDAKHERRQALDALKARQL